MNRDIKYVDENFKTIVVSVKFEEGFKIADSAVNKALMIAMNYLVENIETEKQEEPE